MTGIDPYEYVNLVSIQLEYMENQQQLEEVLDKLEYLFEVIPPELQEFCQELISKVKHRLEHLS